MEGGREWAPEPQAPALFGRDPNDQGLLRSGACQEVPLCTAPLAEMETVGKRKHLPSQPPTSPLPNVGDVVPTLEELVGSREVAWSQDCQAATLVCIPQ